MLFWLPHLSLAPLNIEIVRVIIFHAIILIIISIIIWWRQIPQIEIAFGRLVSVAVVALRVDAAGMMGGALGAVGQPWFLTIAPARLAHITVDPTAAHNLLRLVDWFDETDRPGIRVGMGMGIIQVPKFSCDWDAGEAFGLICHGSKNIRTRINSKKIIRIRICNRIKFVLI